MSLTGDFAAFLNGHANTGHVTFNFGTLDSPSLLDVAIDANGVAQHTVSSPTGSFTPYPVSSPYIVNDTFLGSTSNTLQYEVSVPITVAAPVVNGDQTGLLASTEPQRSMVNSIVYVFNQAVNLDMSDMDPTHRAVVVSLHPTVNIGGIAYNSGYGTVPTVVLTPSDGGLTWTATFTGTPGRSPQLLDRRWHLRHRTRQK